MTNALIKAFIRREQLHPHPHCSRRFVFDGHRSLGWATGGLETWERSYFQACKRIFRAIKPAVVWDVGANVGIWTLFLADMIDSGSIVMAYEPDEVNLRWLARNISINSLGDRVIIRPLALSANQGVADFRVDAMTGSTGSLELNDAFITRYYGRPARLATVATSTADHELVNGIAPPNFLKVDIEGHEYQFLVGAKQLLEKVRPVMIVEFTGPRCGDAARHLRKHGYALLCPNTGEPRENPEYELVAAPLETTALIRSALTASM